MLARPPAKVIYRPPTSIFLPRSPYLLRPPKHLYHSVSQGNYATHLAANEI